MNKIVWVGEPSRKYDERLKRWPRWTTWPFKIEGDDQEFIMNEHQHEIYLAEEEIEKVFRILKLGNVATEMLEKVIEKYGEAREDKGKYDVEENYAESRG